MTHVCCEVWPRFWEDVPSRYPSHARIQWPVGHGGFHLGMINLARGGKPFWYVYDCGSRAANRAGVPSGALKAAISSTQDLLGNADIDVLFVSHLHWDHVSGISALLQNRAANRVVLPYLDPLQRLLLIAQRRAVGAERRMLLDPVAYFTEAGASGEPSD